MNGNRVLNGVNGMRIGSLKERRIRSLKRRIAKRAQFEKAPVLLLQLLSTLQKDHHEEKQKAKPYAMAPYRDSTSLTSSVLPIDGPSVSEMLWVMAIAFLEH